MELVRGTCFCCDMTKVISLPPENEVQKILFSLFTDKIFNINALKKCAPLLRLCPSCLHKLILMKKTNEQIQLNNKIAADEKSNTTCSLCGKEGLGVKITHSWNHFKEISEDFSLFDDAREIIMCSGCIFYLDSRNLVKTKLCIKYPQLKEVPKLKLNLKEAHTHSTSISARKMYIRMSERVSVEMMNSSSDSEVLELDLSSLSRFRALKYDKSLKKLGSIINGDSKFMNQILYIKVNRKDLQSMNFTRDKYQKSQQTKSIDSVDPNYSKTKQDMNVNKQSMSTAFHNDISANIKYEVEHTIDTSKQKSEIRCDSSDENITVPPKQRSRAFFKIKFRKNKKTSKQNNQILAAHKKKYLHLIEPDFNKKLVINIERYSNRIADQSFDEENKFKNDIICIEDSGSEESLDMEVDEVGDEKISDDSIEKLQHISKDDLPEMDEKIDEEIINPNDIETISDEAIKGSTNENDEGESVSEQNNELEKEMVSSTEVSEDADADNTKNTEAENEDGTEEIVKTIDENACIEDNTDGDREHLVEEHPPNDSASEKNETDEQTDQKSNVANPETDNTDDVENTPIEDIEMGSNNEENEEACLNDEDDSEKNKEADDLNDANEDKENEKDDCLNAENTDNIKESEQDDVLNVHNENVIKEHGKDGGLDDEVGCKSMEDETVGVEDEDTSKENEADSLNDQDLGSGKSNEESMEEISPLEISEDTIIEEDNVTTECKKRKLDDSNEDVSGPDKKKKKVTFSDLILESTD